MIGATVLTSLVTIAVDWNFHLSPFAQVHFTNHLIHDFKPLSCYVQWLCSVHRFLVGKKMADI